MNKRNCCIALVLLACLGACNRTKVVDDSRLKTADQDKGNWLMYGRTYNDQRFSPLDQVNPQTVSKLGLVWSRELGTTRGLEATPLVHDGVMFTTSTWSVVYAMDAKTGAVKWKYDPKVPRDRAYFVCCDSVNRGLALYKGKVYVGALDGRLIALDEVTGNPVWTAETTDPAKPYTVTSAPRIARGLVMIGNAGSEYGVRGYVSAYDAETGKMAWRTYTVPGDPSKGFESKAMENAAKTWHGEWWVAGGGGTVWEGIAYDPELDLAYFGTGNATAWYRALRGEGDALYTASIVAVHAGTGEMAWYFQNSPGDNWDYDSTQPLVQADLTINGKPRKVIMQANKNGFFYVLDRQTGEFISGAPFVDGVNWASGLDSKGRPIETKAAYDGMKPIIVSPDTSGGHNWNPIAFHPGTGLVYLAARLGTHTLHAPKASWKYDPDRANVGGDEHYEGPMAKQNDALPPSRGELLAWDPVKQTPAWHTSFDGAHGGGVLATAGDLIFVGRYDGIFAAYNAKDGKQVWQFDAGTGIVAAPSTYLVDGHQYISVMAGMGGSDGLSNDPATGKIKQGYGRILTFAIGGTAELKIPAFGHSEPPSPAIEMKASREMIHEGGLLFSAECSGCHGVNAVGGGLPDLRYASKDVHEHFEEIVLGGKRAPLGMPSFQKVYKPEQVRAIQAYILSRAAEGAKQAGTAPKVPRK
jgi:quinohemoprotein ethanol dehydrogenase